MAINYKTMLAISNIIQKIVKVSGSPGEGL